MNFLVKERFRFQSYIVRIKTYNWRWLDDNSNAKQTECKESKKKFSGNN